MRGWAILFGLMSAPGVGAAMAGVYFEPSLKTLTIVSLLLLSAVAATSAIRVRPW